jgi:hypothetical protein
MRTLLARRWLRVVFLSCFLFAVVGMAHAAAVDLKALKSIAIPEQPAELEKLATTLAGLVKEAYGVDLPVVKTAAPDKEPAILLDRALAVGSEMISQQELADVKYDGYVIKAAENRIAVSGFRTRGTRYGVLLDGCIRSGHRRRLGDGRDWDQHGYDDQRKDGGRCVSGHRWVSYRRVLFDGMAK